MIQIKLKNVNNPDKWITIKDGNNSVHIRGYLYYKHKLLKGNELANFIQKLAFDEILRILKDVNGFFAVIKKKENKLIAVVDRLRSIPLFYGLEGKNFYLSDDPHWILERIADKSCDMKSQKEFLATGYVTGSDTLYKNIKQIQAGEVLLFTDNANTNVNIETKRYYKYIKQSDFTENFDILLEALDDRVNNVFERLIKVLDGRPVVIPLSGGYDSRLIAVMMKEFNYENVICFSYGRPGNTESKISQQVARNLGYRWEFVPYSNKSWHNWYYSKEMQHYMLFGGGFSSVPHIQDWPAVWELKKNDRIPENSIFIPGHSADFIAGSHITNIYKIYGKVYGEEKLLKTIVNYHYNLYKWPKRDFLVFRDKILSFLSSGEWDIETFEGLANFFEYWDWQERQAKFIVNSVRVYEFWGYDWLIPLWDNELMDFFIKVPLEYRLNKKLYDTYVKNKYGKFTSGNQQIILGYKSMMIRYLKRLLYMLFLDKSVRRFYIKNNHMFKKFLYKKEYYNHPLGWYGIIELDEFKKVYTGRENINTFLSRKYLNELNSISNIKEI